MNGKDGLVKTEFWSVGLEDLESVKTELEWLSKKYGLFAKRMAKILENAKETNEYELEELLYDICSFVEDCSVCPLRFNCNFALEACSEVYLCETCPRLRMCVQNGSKGLLIYLRDSKNGGREE